MTARHLLHLKQSHPDLVEAIETMNCGLIGRDAEGILSFVNERMLSWLGYTREELEGQHAKVLVPPELGDVVQHEMAAAEEGDLRVRLTIFRRKDSTTFPVLVIPQRVSDSEGRFAGTMAVIVDVGAVQTAKPAGYGGGTKGVGARLERIAIEIQTVALVAGVGPSASVPLHHPSLKDLTAREREVLMILMAGDRVSAIAEQLHLSPHTIRNHLKSMYRKLQVPNQAELIQRVRTLAGLEGEHRHPGR